MRSDHRTADQPAISFLLNDRPHYQCGAKHEQYQVGQPKRHRLALNDAVPAIIAVPFLFLGSHRSPKPPALALLALALRHEGVLGRAFERLAVRANGFQRARLALTFRQEASSRGA